VARAAYLLTSDDALIAQCEVDRYRASGPGGQHRNKTESAVRLRHKPSGVTAIGEDSRSQAENKLHAVRRLRAAIALDVREPITPDGPGGLDHYVPSPRLAALVAGGTAPLGAKTRLTGEFWAAIAELLDLLVAGGLEIGATAQRLGITTGALSKLLLHDDHIARAVNDLRRGRQMRPLR
jgi:peptide chain release factor-like protein